MELEHIISAPLTYKLGYVILPVGLQLPGEVHLDGETYFAKPAFHCSLVCVKWIVSKLSDAREESSTSRQVLEVIEEARSKTEPKLLGFKDELRQVQRGDHRTIIVMANVAGLEPLFEALRDKLSIDIPMQPTHVTIYSNIADKKGIGVTSQAELNDTHIISGQSLAALKREMEFDRAFSEMLS